MRSHVDMIIFCSYFHIHACDLTSEQITVVKNGGKQQMFQLWLEISGNPNKLGQLSFHEKYHYYQGLRLPYLTQLASYA